MLVFSVLSSNIGHIMVLGVLNRAKGVTGRTSTRWHLTGENRTLLPPGLVTGRKRSPGLRRRIPYAIVPHLRLEKLRSHVPRRSIAWNTRSIATNLGRTMSTTTRAKWRRKTAIKPRHRPSSRQRRPILAAAKADQLPLNTSPRTLRHLSTKWARRLLFPWWLALSPGDEGLMGKQCFRETLKSVWLAAAVRQRTSRFRQRTSGTSISFLPLPFFFISFPRQYFIFIIFSEGKPGRKAAVKAKREP